MSPRRRPRASALACIAAIAIVASVDTAATATWTRPAAIASLHAPVHRGCSSRAGSPNCSSAPEAAAPCTHGRTAIAPERSTCSPARARRRGPLGPTLDLSWSQSFYDDAQIAVGPRGHTIIVWSRPAMLMQSALQARANVGCW